MKISLILITLSLGLAWSCNKIEVHGDAFRKARLVGSASNNPPVLDPLSDEAVSEANPVTTIDLGDGGDDFDADGNQITYGCNYDTLINGSIDSPLSDCSTLPGAVTFNSSTGLFNWTPNYSASGIYEVWFSASDDVHVDHKHVTYTITNVNRPPVLDPLASPVTGNVTVPLATINVNDGGNDTDIDGTPLVYSCLFDTNNDGVLTLPGTNCTSLGGTVTFNTSTGVFNWTPSNSAYGTYELWFTGSDGIASDSKAVAMTIVDPSLGNFSILGVTGGSDVTQDSRLDFTLNPVINWGASTGAASYDIKLFANDGVTAIGCGTVTGVVGTSYNFSSCALAAGTSYKVRVTARSALGGGKNSLNDLYSFKTNSLPVAVNDGPFYIFASGNITVGVLTDNIATVAYDPDTDPDGDTITLLSKTNGSKGTTSISGSNIVYTATPGQVGQDTFTYTIGDGHGGSATGTVTVYLISGYTWIGAVDSNWNNPGNWCGSINANKTSCSGGSTLPDVTDTVYFNGSCINCIVNINTNVDVAQFQMDADFTGTINQNTFMMNIRNRFTQNGGTFSGGSGNISLTDYFVVNGGTFKSTSGELYLYHDQGCCDYSTGNFVVNSAATFNHNNGTVKLRGDAGNGSGYWINAMEIDAPNISFYNLTINTQDTLPYVDGPDGTMLSIKSGEINVMHTYTQEDGRFVGGKANIFGNAVFTCTSPEICSAGGGDGGNWSTDLVFKASFPIIQTMTVTGNARVPSVIIAGTGTVNVVSDVNTLSVEGIFKQTDGVFNAPSGWMNLRPYSLGCCIVVQPEGFRILGGTFNDNGVSLALGGYNANTGGDTPGVGTFQVPLGFSVKNFQYAHQFDYPFSHWDFTPGTIVNVTGDFIFSDGYIQGMPTFNVQGDIYFQCAGGDVCAEASPGFLNVIGANVQIISQDAGAGVLTSNWTVNKTAGALNLSTNLTLNGNDQDLDLLSGVIHMFGYNLTVKDATPGGNDLTLGPNTLIDRGVTPGTIDADSIVMDPSASITP